jgi:hypothetical protein
MKKNILTVSEIMAHCNCTKHKVNSYIYHHHMLPYSLTTRGSKKDVRQYELTPEMEEFLKTPTEPRGEASSDPEREAKRIADGWLTGNEITEMWGCSYMKTIDILVTSHAEWKWEDGKPYQGRKLWKIPETLSRQPTVHKVPARISTKKDWIDSLPKIDGAQTKEMVLDERRGKKLVGKTVVVEMKGSGVVFTGKLEFYNMICFSIKDDRGVVHTYKTREAQVVKELEV